MAGNDAAASLRGSAARAAWSRGVRPRRSGLRGLAGGRGARRRSLHSFRGRRGAGASGRCDRKHGSGPDRLRGADDGGIVAAGDGSGYDVLRRGDRSVRTAEFAAAAEFLFLDDGDDVVILAVAGNRDRRGSVAMGEDAYQGVGAGLHEQACHRGIAAQDGIVQRAMLIIFRGIHTDEFRPGFEEGARGSKVAGLDNLVKAGDVRAIDKGFELRPTLEAVSASEDTLRVVKRESGRTPFETADLGERSGVVRAVTIEQVFGLFAELVEIGMPRRRRSGTCSDMTISFVARCPRKRAERRFASYW